MTKLLDDLAEVVRQAYRAGFIASCKWPEPVTQDVDSPAYNKEFNQWSFSVREKHASIAAEIERNARDAARYRWLRDLSNRTAGKRNITTGYNDGESYCLWNEEMDAAIDAAMQEAGR